MAIKLIIFDLDGTLIDSIEDITAALNNAFSPYGVSDLTAAETTPLIGEGPAKLVQDVMAKRNLSGDTKELVTRFLDYYNSHPADKASLYPGAGQMLDALKDLKMAIVTNKTEELSHRILDTFGISQYFEIVVAVDTIAERKPSAAPVIHVLSALNVSPEETIIVGDSSIDVQTGKAASVRTVAVTHGYGKNGFQKEADYVISGLPELIKIAKQESVI